jgi:adenosylcobinamide-GDP ribazoletransferase
MAFMRGFFSLLSFLTIYPVPGRYRSIYDAAQYFPLAPLAGFLRGVPVFVLAYILSHYHLGNLVAGASIAIHMVVQGFLHIDGLIDYGEALLAHRFGRDAGKVMKDRYRGSYGVAVASVYVVLLYSSMESISLEHLPAILLFGEVVEGASMVVTLYLGREEPYRGLGKIFRERLGLGDVIVSVFISLAIYMIALYPITSWVAVYPFIISIASSMIIPHIANRVPGYVSGDVLGFSGELCYLIFIVSWVFL